MREGNATKCVRENWMIIRITVNARLEQRVRFWCNGIMVELSQLTDSDYVCLYVSWENRS